MKKSRYYPFERNRYFYGKLLTVRDFESEQKYVGDKRRLLNRLLVGSGVVSGMHVVAVDDKSITVEMGVAIDYAGREIVIPSPTTLKLSMIEGFTNNEYKKNVYLYAAYDEKGKEPVHAIANSAVRSEDVSEYNRVLESYRLFIKEEAPDPASFEHVRLSEVIAPIYQDGQVRIYQRMPKYAGQEAVVDVTLVVEKTLQTPRISLEYQVEADGLTPVGLADGLVSFSEPGDGQETEYTYTYSVKAANWANGRKASLRIDSQSFVLNIGDLRVPIDSNPTHEVEIISESAVERIMRDYFDRTLDQAVDGVAEQSICLAKISLLQMGPTYMIEGVERVPFGEYVYNPSLLQRVGAFGTNEQLSKFFTSSEAFTVPFGEEPRLDVDYNPERSEFSFKLGVPQPQHLQDEMATGTVTVELEPNAKSGLYFFSRGQKNYVTGEIESGLGEGQLYVMVGLEDKDVNITSDLLQASDQVYYGSSDVFKGSEFESQLPNVTFGTVVYPSKGTFRIGMKLGQATEASAIKLRWWAFKKLPGTETAVVVESAATTAAKVIQAGMKEAAASTDK
ncbi:hypothetical protein [Paenibacillus lignilyticus]|uniref:DUF4179 domain-containing protein n=1 Tax=Paenibacillus lignilyticus TaxID=1172615 RepID=A0ABS5C5M3_9BACL|nr:hypothetical protein [Paenibacillus lignilyticus]MBP3961281.1 hypothetical protein [Paenibacillus lignilyticus]